MISCAHKFIQSNIALYEQCVDCSTYRSLAPADPGLIYSSGYWDGVKRSQIADQDYNITKHKEGGLTKGEFLFNQIWTQDRSAALDIGCAPGSLLRMLKEKAGFDRVAGIDVDPDVEPDILKIAGEGVDVSFGLFPGASRETCQWTRWTPGQFSLILASDVFEHVPEPVPFLTECHRLLKPDGQLLLMTPLISADYTMPLRFFDPGEHVLLHSKAHIERLLDITGFAKPAFARWTEGHDTVTVRRL